MLGTNNITDCQNLIALHDRCLLMIVKLGNMWTEDTKVKILTTDVDSQTEKQTY